MVLEKGSFGQMPIVQPQKMGSFGQDTQDLREIYKISLIFYVKNENWEVLGSKKDGF